MSTYREHDKLQQKDGTLVLCHVPETPERSDVKLSQLQGRLRFRGKRLSIIRHDGFVPSDAVDHAPCVVECAVVMRRILPC